MKSIQNLLANTIRSPRYVTTADGQKHGDVTASKASKLSSAATTPQDSPRICSAQTRMQILSKQSRLHYATTSW